MTITTVLFDLDGVLRHFDPATAGHVEDAHGLTHGRIEAAAFDPDLLERVTLGEITNHEWVTAIGERIGSATAAAEWRSQPFTVDLDVLDVARDLRAGGVHVSIFSNATDGLRAELTGSPLIEVMECIFNSSELRRAKPAAEAYVAVLDELRVDPQSVLFVDDRLANVEGARAIGIVGHHHRGRGAPAAATLRDALRAAGLVAHHLDHRSTDHRSTDHRTDHGTDRPAVGRS